MADRKVSALTELAVTPATGDLFHVVDISEAADADKNKYITWSTIDAAVDTIIAANNSGFLVAASDLSDVANAATARTNLGLGTIATQAAASVAITGGSITGITDLTIADGGTGQSTAQAAIDALTDVTSATNEHVLTKDTATGNAIFKAATGGGGGLSDVVDDLTPQLGGNLDVNGQSIVSVSAGDISITPDTTGSIILDGLSWPQSDGTANYVLETDGAGQLGWVAQSGGGGSPTLADIATNSTTTAHQTFALDAATQFIIEDSGGTDILTVDEATGLSTFADNVIIDGSADAVQLSVQAHSTQTSNLAVFEDSSGTDLVYIEGDGVVNVTPGGTALPGFVSSIFPTLNVAATKAAGQVAGISLHNASGGGYTEIMTANNGGSLNHRCYIGVGGTTVGGAYANRGYIVSSSSLDGLRIEARKSNAGITFHTGGTGQKATLNSSGDFQVGSGSPSARLHIADEDAVTNTVVNTQIIGKNTTGTAAAGFGSAVLFQLESSTTADQDAARISVPWTTATHASRTADIVFENVDNAAALAETFRIISDGALGMQADITTDTAPTDDTTRKRLSIQRLGSDPTNAAFIKFSNSPGTPTNDFYLVLEEG